MLYTKIAYYFLTGNLILYLTGHLGLHRNIPNALGALVRALIGFSENTEHAGDAGSPGSAGWSYMSRDLIVRPPPSLIPVPTIDIASQFTSFVPNPLVGPLVSPNQLVSKSSVVPLVLVIIMIMLVCLHIPTWLKTTLRCADDNDTSDAEIYDEASHLLAKPCDSSFAIYRIGDFISQAALMDFQEEAPPAPIAFIDFQKEAIPSVFVDNGNRTQAIDKVTSRIGASNVGLVSSGGKLTRTKIMNRKLATAGHREVSQSIVSGKATEIPKISQSIISGKATEIPKMESSEVDNCRSWTGSSTMITYFMTAANVAYTLNKHVDICYHITKVLDALAAASITFTGNLASIGHGIIIRVLSSTVPAIVHIYPALTVKLADDIRNVTLISHSAIIDLVSMIPAIPHINLTWTISPASAMQLALGIAAIIFIIVCLYILTWIKAMCCMSTEEMYYARIYDQTTRERSELHESSIGIIDPASSETQLIFMQSLVSSGPYRCQ